MIDGSTIDQIIQASWPLVQNGLITSILGGIAGISGYFIYYLLHRNDKKIEVKPEDAEWQKLVDEYEIPKPPMGIGKFQ